MRVIVTASREWKDVALMRRRLSEISTRPLTIVHGGAPGGDRIADQWARDTPGVEPEPHPRRGDQRFGGDAIFVWRNQFMVDLGATLCLGFIVPGHSPGTLDCMARAREAGILTIGVDVYSMAA